MNIELLAPAGNLEKLKIAFQYGADAVYIAGQRFGLRSAAGNFSTFEIQEAVTFARSLGKKVYITLNAFLHEEDLAGLPDFLEFLDRIQVDAVICSDLGVVELVTRHTGIPVHISTQASVLNSHHARIWKDCGAKRIVVGRELSIREAAEIKEDTGLEIEMFVHGAMCMSYSGHCTLSTYIAGRDSNRGGCIQNCRFNYTFYEDGEKRGNAYFMSSKDLCGIGLLDRFLEYGIDSLKIEGRMKSNLYIASTVRAYANALADLEKGDRSGLSEWTAELAKIPHREYTTGSLEAPAGADSVYGGQRPGMNDYKLAGTVLAVNRETSKFAIQVKNKLLPGDVIEVLPFQGGTIEVTIGTIVNVVGTELSVAQPGSVIWLPWRTGIDTHTVARIYRPE